MKPHFDIVDWVFLKSQPYRQLLTKLVRNQKTLKAILRSLSYTSADDQLPTNSTFSNLLKFIPLSLLKPHKGDEPIPSTPHLPPTFLDNHPILKPTSNLYTRTVRTDSSTTNQVLVQWDGLPRRKPLGRMLMTSRTMSILKEKRVDITTDSSFTEHGLIPTKHGSHIC